MQTFKVGQSVVHLSYGIGIVKSIEQRSFISDSAQKFYIVEIQDQGAPKKVFVPFDNAETRLRPIMDKNMAKEVLNYIATGKADDMDAQTWNRRYRNYMELIHTGNALNVAKVYVALKTLRDEKDLSFGERKMLDQVKNLLSKEFEAIGMPFPLDRSIF